WPPVKHPSPSGRWRNGNQSPQRGQAALQRTAAATNATDRLNTGAMLLTGIPSAHGRSALASRIARHHLTGSLFLAQASGARANSGTPFRPGGNFPGLSPQAGDQSGTPKRSRGLIPFRSKPSRISVGGGREKSQSDLGAPT